MRISGAAITGLICGVFGCIPLITGIAAMVFSLIGIGATAKSNVRGRGMAVAGLVLGSISLSLWGGLSALFVHSYFTTQPERAVTRQFYYDLSQGIDRVESLHCANSLSQYEMDQYVRAFRSWGTFESVQIFFAFHDTSNGISRGHVNGLLQFTNGASTTFHLGMIKINGRWLIDAIVINRWTPMPTPWRAPRPSTPPPSDESHSDKETAAANG